VSGTGWLCQISCYLLSGTTLSGISDTPYAGVAGMFLHTRLGTYRKQSPYRKNYKQIFENAPFNLIIRTFFLLSMLELNVNLKINKEQVNYYTKI
jgi:hypothetical protein